MSFYNTLLVGTEFALLAFKDMLTNVIMLKVIFQTTHIQILAIAKAARVRHFSSKIAHVSSKIGSRFKFLITMRAWYEATREMDLSFVQFEITS